MARSINSEDVILNIIAELDRNSVVKATTDMNKLIASADNPSEIRRILNDRVKNRQDAIKRELVAEDNARKQELASFKASILERDNLLKLKERQAMESNKRMLLDEENTRRKELAMLKASIISRGTPKTEQSGSGAGYFSQRTQFTNYDDTGYKSTQASMSKYYGELEKGNAKAAEAVARSHTQAARKIEDEYKKSFMGAITEGTTFGHKMATTAQYMAAGMGLMAISNGITSMVAAFAEADMAMGSFRAILEMTDAQATKLKDTVYSIGTTYGGSVKELNDSALALGRAGIANDALAESIKVVSQAALVSGETLGEVTDLLVSWSTVYPDKTMTQLGDSITAAANASIASISDFKTMTTYMLTAGQQAGVTSDALIAMGATWRQIGKAPSTSGTEIRRFFEQLSTGGEEVRKAYWKLGIDIDKLKTNLAKGGAESEAAMRDMYARIQKVVAIDGTKALDGISLVLDKATMQSLIAGARLTQDTAGNWVTTYDKMLSEIKAKSAGATEKAASEMALTWSKMWERVKVAMSAGSAGLGEEFTKSVLGGITNEEYNQKIEAFASGFENSMKTIGGALSILGTSFIGLTKLIGLLLDNTSWLKDKLVEIGSFTGVAFVGYLGEATIAAIAFNKVLAVNPIVAWGTAIITATAYLKEYLDLKDQIEGNTTKLSANTGFIKDIQNIGTFSKAEDKVKATGVAIDNLNTRLQALYKRQETASGKDLLKPNRDAITKDILVYQQRISLLSKFQDTLLKGKVPTKKETPAVTADLGATGQYTPKDTDNKAENRAKRIAKQSLDDNLALIRLKESEYFLNNNIESQLVQKQYHLSNTLALELKALQGAGAYDDKQEDIRKKKREIVTATIDMHAASTKATEEYNKQLVALGYQVALVGVLSEKEKLSITNEQRLNEFAVERDKKLKEAYSIREKDLVAHRLKNKLIKEANETYDIQVGLQKVLTTEQLRQIDLAKIQRDNTTTITRTQLEGQGARIASEAILSEKKALGLKLENDRLKVMEQYKTLDDTTGMENELKNLQLAYELDLKRIQGAETYNDLLMESNKTFERNNSEAQRFMRVTEGGISALTSGLSTFFDKTSSGYLNLSTLTENLTRALIKGLWDELVVNQIILQVRRQIAATNTSSSGGGTDWVGMLGSFFGGASGGTTAQAKGGINLNGNPTYLANGGSYVNSLVKKPTYVANGTIAGESGAEAVMPLQRDSQGRLGVISSGSGVQGVQNVQVQIVNQSGEELKVTKSESKFDGENFVLSVVLDAINRNKSGMRDAIKGTK